MAGKSTVLQRLRMNQGFGLNDTERLRMRKSNIRGLIDVFAGAVMRYELPMPAHIHKVCSRDSGPICCRGKIVLTQLASHNVGLL